MHLIRTASSRACGLGERNCRNPEEFKTQSQNLGMEGVLTTFSSYGPVSEQRQAELIKTLAARRPEQGINTALVIDVTGRMFGEACPSPQCGYPLARQRSHCYAD